jgi:protein-S-isoprenylcysteine O-methyltransferase
VALLASWTEYWIEALLFGSMKRSSFFIFIGLLLVLGGQGVRSVAMYTCGEHFSHQIMESRVDSHKLVTTGVYS